jgi:hypothetical protein
VRFGEEEHEHEHPTPGPGHPGEGEVDELGQDLALRDEEVVGADERATYPLYVHL